MSGSKAASLTVVKVRRGPRPAAGSDKAGDITAQLQATPGHVSEFLPLARARSASPKTEKVTFVLPPALALDASPTPPLPEIEPIEWQVPATTPKLRGYWEFVDYWDRLRRGRRLPTLAMLDRDFVAGHWPDSLVVTYTPANPSMPQIARLGKPTGDIEYTPMVTDWIITCAQQVARDGEAMEDEQEFPLPGGVTGYRLLLLPFAGDAGKSDHVVCHLSRALPGQPARL